MLQIHASATHGAMQDNFFNTKNNSLIVLDVPEDILIKNPSTTPNTEDQSMENHARNINILERGNSMPICTSPLAFKNKTMLEPRNPQNQSKDWFCTISALHQRNASTEQT